MLKRMSKLTIGLTGGIASGKSAVSSRMREAGAVVIDADALAREVVAPGTEGLKQVIGAFGEQLLTAEGALDRPALGRIVFNDEQALQQLNAIVHPLVRAEAERRRAEAAADDVVVEDIPLLVESGQYERFDLVVVVQAPEDERIRRMVTDRGMSRQDACARMASQASDAQRAEVADVVLDNSGSLQELHAQVDELMSSLEADGN